MKIEFTNGSTFESVDGEWVDNCVRIGNVKYREWAEEEIESFKNTLKDIKNNLHRLYSH